jgi:hypothetical protein
MADEGVHRFNLTLPQALWRRFSRQVEAIRKKKNKEEGTDQQHPTLTECAVEAIDEWTHTREA